MHPFAARPQRFGLYLLTWSLPLLFLASGLQAGHLRIGEIAILLFPLCIFYSLVCLTPWYTCRFLPLRTASIARITVNHLAAALIAGVLWMTLARGIGALVGRWDSTFPARLAPQLPLLFGSGVFLYLLAVTIHYVYFTWDAAQEEGRRAKEAQILARDAELKALKAQINPHFLFNSLNSISALTTVDAAKARDMCLKLSDFLRTTLRLGGEQNIPLSEEIRLARTYLEVEQVRFGRRLSIEFAIDGTCEGAMVPPLIVQPLVENAVKHGIAGLVDGGTVRVSAATDRGLLRVAVENGYDPETPSPRRSGLGLTNIRDRLAARYGDAARLDVLKTANLFRAELILPRAE
jgi:two-component system sensor histidine kinase AlgZ